MRPSAWVGPAIALKTELWRGAFDVNDLTILGNVADAVVNNSDSQEIRMDTLDDFLEPIRGSNLQSKLNLILDVLIEGIGFYVIKGLPVQDWGPRKSSAAVLVLGRLLGSLRMQNAQGHVLGHVRDLGVSSSNPSVRVYQTNERQTFHTDSCDIVGLLCLHPALEGGYSSIVSAETIYNEILEKRPDLLEELCEPVPTDRRGEVPVGMDPFYIIPVFNEFDGLVSVIYQRQYINSSQRFEGAPRLTVAQVEALNLFDSLADDPRLHFNMKLEAGDIQLVHNHNMLHDRTAFIDYPDNTRKRHLLRIWVSPSRGRELPPIFAERFGTVEVGNRGGIHIEGVKPIAKYA